MSLSVNGISNSIKLLGVPPDLDKSSSVSIKDGDRYKLIFRPSLKDFLT